MEVILQTRVPNLGNLGDKVNVKNGYARNYLIPQGMAITANKANLAIFEARRAELEQKAAEALAAAQARADAMSELAVTIAMQASEEGKLYGSVGVAEIVAAVAEAGHELQKREVLLPNGVLRDLGEFTIELQLHSDVNAAIKVNVVAA